MVCCKLGFFRGQGAFIKRLWQAQGPAIYPFQFHSFPPPNLSGSQVEELIEPVSAHIFPELHRVNVIVPVIPGAGNSVPKGEKATLKADSHELFRLTQAPGRLPGADPGNGWGRFFDRGNVKTHQVFHRNPKGIRQRLDLGGAGGVLPGQVLTDSGLGTAAFLRQGRLAHIGLGHCILQALTKIFQGCSHSF